MKLGSNKMNCLFRTKITFLDLNIVYIFLII